MSLFSLLRVRGDERNVRIATLRDLQLDRSTVCLQHFMQHTLRRRVPAMDLQTSEARRGRNLLVGAVRLAIADVPVADVVIETKGRVANGEHKRTPE